ncbi:unnamed protein product [Nezara viridula]|uniref:Uncharacterized protein n=1 Tax=Nezara viridula TaxID=85310 RepID=A0A9P0MMZ0_NEZVI|nr:unnamed protein product [Nezara viridula]
MISEREGTPTLTDLVPIGSVAINAKNSRTCKITTAEVIGDGYSSRAMEEEPRIHRGRSCEILLQDIHSIFR